MSLSIDEQKKQIRQEIKQLKQKYSIGERKKMSASILKKLEKLEEFKAAKTAMLYWSMDDEVFSHDFVCKWAEKKRIVLPCIKNLSLELKLFKGKHNLVCGENYGILEPEGEVFSPQNEIDFILVPGIAFDINNNRMGRGKAYYDQLLKSINAYKTGICFPFQLLNQVPVDEHDIKMDHVIS